MSSSDLIQLAAASQLRNNQRPWAALTIKKGFLHEFCELSQCSCMARGLLFSGLHQSKGTAACKRENGTRKKQWANTPLLTADRKTKKRKQNKTVLSSWPCFPKPSGFCGRSFVNIWPWILLWRRRKALLLITHVKVTCLQVLLHSRTAVVFFSFSCVWQIF